MVPVAPPENLEINVMELKKAAMIYRAINHKLRQQILQILHQRERIKVTDIFVKLRMEQSIVSQHLGILRRANLVQTEREGKMIFYSVQYDRLRQLHHATAELLSDKAL